MNRHYGMDWLRIGAFGLLIFYHIGMVFVPWPFQVKTANPLAWVEIPMFLTSPWRLTLLFVVAGYASRALLAKSSGVGAFFKDRSGRLLVPLLFGVAVVVPPQSWVELVTQHGYVKSYTTFLLHDYFRFGKLDGIILPTWNHLWFVAYLWIYTAILSATAALAGKARIQQLFDTLFQNWRALVLPTVYILLLEVVLFRQTEDTHDLVGDGVAHLRYFPAFLFGFGLAGSPTVLAAFARQWRIAAALAIGCFLTIAALLVRWPDFSFPADPTIIWSYRIARHVETWTAIAALVGIAERFGNRDHPWRATLAEATFPFYIIHQTIIVLVEGWLLQFDLGAAAEFVILAFTTVAGCWTFYSVGRHVAWLRPLIGLRMRRPRGSRR